MQRRNTALLLAAAAIVALAAVVWRFAAGDPEPAPTTDGGTPSVVVPDGPAVLSGEPAASGPFDGPRVVVGVLSRERFVEPRPSRVQAVQLPHREPLPTVTVAGTGSSPWSDERRAGVALVRVEADGGSLVRQIGVEAAGVSELGLGSMLAVRGRVQDTSGAPIADAAVWLGELDAAGRERLVTTDENGAFEARVRASDGVPLAVHRDGYASSWRPIRVHVDVANEHMVTLVPCGRLTFQIAGIAEHLDRGRLFFAPTGPRDADLSLMPFFRQSLRNGAGIGASGGGVIENLPQHGTLALTVVHPQIAIGEHCEVALDGERTACVVPLEFAPAWSGKIWNDAGVALAGATVLVRPGGREVRSGSGLNMLPPQLLASGCYFASTDADGNFLCGASRVPGTLVSLRAPGHAGRDLDLAGILGAGDSPDDGLWLPAWTGGELVLRLQPPLSGEPWRAEFDLGGGTVIDCKADEDAVISLPHPGLFDIVATTHLGGERRGEREYRGVSATGPVLVPSPKIE